MTSFLARFSAHFAWFFVTLVSFQAHALSTADHSKFKELQKPFASGPEATTACLTCHTEAAKQIHKTKHWTWEFLNPDNEQRLGKRNILNNFCISPQSNYKHCTACHVGYGWEDEQFDFTAEQNVDCLVCHDTTGDYFKSSDNAGRPRTTVDLSHVAQNVGKTSRDTCGACHFFGGGGNGVKHGDMDDSLAVPDREVDVHMDAVGADFTCSTCHESKDHDVSGSRYTPEAAHEGGYHIRSRDYGEDNQANCRACHDNTPHKSDEKDRLDHHAEKIACQTCHIPKMARGGVATRMSWDWSTAGKLDKQGKPYEEKLDGKLFYSSNRGSFTYGQDIEPEYVWFNGTVHYQLLEAALEPDENGVVHINEFEGNAEDGKSRIWPIKVFRGKQPYDPVNSTLIVAHTSGHDDTGYWQNLDWNKAITAGMLSAGKPFSGKVGFIETKMSWPITHMVAPAQDALECQECHKKDGRLEAIDDIYIPGRHARETLDFVSWGRSTLPLMGVLAHTSVRLFSFYRRKRT